MEESKGKAQDAIQKIPAIENLINRAENKTQEARDALSGAESDANTALSLAQLAQVTATNASKVSVDIGTFFFQQRYKLGFFKIRMLTELLRV